MASNKKSPMQTALRNLDKAVEKVKKLCNTPTTLGKFVNLEDVGEGNLICFVTDDGDIKCGYAIHCYNDSVTVVLNERKRKTTLAGRKIWRVEDLSKRQSKSIDDTFKDKDFHHEAFKNWKEAGTFVKVKDVDTGTLICFKTNDGDIKFGYVLDCTTNDVTVVVEGKIVETLESGTKIWAAKGSKATQRDGDTFEDQDFDREEFKIGVRILKHEIDQDKIESGTGVYFHNKTGIISCGYAYKSGSNIRFVCEERVRQKVTRETVWESNAIKTEKRDEFDDNDFEYEEKKIVEDARYLYDLEDIEVITDMIDNLKDRHGK